MFGTIGCEPRFTRSIHKEDTMNKRAYTTILTTLLVNALLFAAGAATVFSLTRLDWEATVLLPVVVLASFAISPFISSWLMSQQWLRRDEPSVYTVDGIYRRTRT
jgi:hypothetical protein